MQLAEAGHPVIIVITEPFRALAETATRARGWGRLPVIVLDRELERLSHPDVNVQARLVSDAILELLAEAAA